MIPFNLKLLNKNEYLVAVSRIFVGLLFIISGFIKLNDHG